LDLEVSEMEHFPWDVPLAGLEPPLDTHIGHYLIAAVVLISLVGWIFSQHGTGLRKLNAVAFGGAIALAAIVLLGHYFPPGPPTPGAMP
jgi:hypothetical protein